MIDFFERVAALRREGQSFAWQALPVTVQPVLPGTLPVLQWFAEERAHRGATLSKA